MRLCRRSVGVFTLFLGLLTVSPPAGLRAEVPVDLELVLAIDVSGSVDPEEARLQRDGYVQAFLNEKVKRAIRGGPFGRIAVIYIEWAGDLHQQIIVNWSMLSDPASVEHFAGTVAEAPITSAQWTSISGAIDYAVTLFDNNGYEGTRRVIDVSGDGENNRGRPAEMARDAAVARGITINGLPILNDRPNPWGGSPTSNLDSYYRNSVIGGPGAFMIPANDFTAFADAILGKLLLEISGLTPDRDVAVEGSGREMEKRHGDRRQDGGGTLPSRQPASDGNPS